MKSLTLYEIEKELVELLELREEATAEGALPDELALIDKQIAEYMTREVKKVDGVANAVRIYRYAAYQDLAEARRLTERANMWNARAQRVKEAALYVMGSLGLTKLETPRNTLRIQKNSGLEPLEVPILENLPWRYRTVTVEIPWDDWASLPWQVDAKKNAVLKSQGYSNTSIREALKQRVKCPECEGNGKSSSALSGAPAGERCPRCEGKGTVPATVPGARLLPRGEHLRIE